MCWKSNDSEEAEAGMTRSRRSPVWTRARSPGLASVLLSTWVPLWASMSLCGGNAPGGLFQVNDTDTGGCEQLQALPAGLSLTLPDSVEAKGQGHPGVMVI